MRNLHKNHQVTDFLARDQQNGVGVHDGLSARLATAHAFDFVWVGSFGLAAAGGWPDVGLLEAGQVLEVVRNIANCTQLPIVVDLEAGYGDSVKLYHVARDMALAGVAAICIEDNTLSKRSSLYPDYDRALMSINEHAARVRASVLAIHELGRANACAVIARTEALVAGHGVAEALARARAYEQAGADAIFVQSVDATGQDILEFCRRWDRITPIFLAPTCYSALPKQILFEAGATHVIYANHAIRAALRAMDTVYASLRLADCSAPVEQDIASISEVRSAIQERQIKNLEVALQVDDRAIGSLQFAATALTSES